MSSVPTFVPVFEESETAIRDRMLTRISDEWRKEPGDFIYDAVVTAPLEIKQLQISQDYTLKNAFTLLAEGFNLDNKVEEVAIYRNSATKALGVLTITAQIGVIIPKGQRLSTIILDTDKNPITVTVDSEIQYTANGSREIAVTTEGTGSIMNVPEGSNWIFQPPIPGVESIKQGNDFTEGRNTEDDETLRDRWKEKRQRPVRSGNKQNYVVWALEVVGVGAAKCFPLWAGRGTVKVIIINTDKKPASSDIVTAVQNYIDPNQDGQGDGTAPIGAVVTVESATQLTINVTASVSVKTGSTIDDALTELQDTLDAYLASVTFVDNAVVVYTKIGGLLSSNSHIGDYDGLTVNAGTANIPIQLTEIPVRGTVTLT